MDDPKVTKIKSAYAILKQVCKEVDGRRPQPKSRAKKAEKENFPLLTKLVSSSDQTSFLFGQGSLDKLALAINNLIRILDRKEVSGFKLEVTLFKDEATNWRDRLNQALDIIAPSESHGKKRDRDADTPTPVSTTPSNSAPQIFNPPPKPSPQFSNPQSNSQSNLFSQFPMTTTPSYFPDDDTATINLTQFLASQGGSSDLRDNSPFYLPPSPNYNEEPEIFTTMPSTEVKEEKKDKQEEDPDLQERPEKKKKETEPPSKASNLVFSAFFAKPQAEKTDDQPCTQLSPFDKHLKELNTKLSGKTLDYWKTYDLKRLEEALKACAAQAEALWEEEKEQFGYRTAEEVGTAKHARAEGLLAELLKGKLKFWNNFVLIENLYLPSQNGGQNFSKHGRACHINGCQAQPPSYPAAQNVGHNPWGGLEPDIVVLQNNASGYEDVEAIYDFKFSGNPHFVASWDDYGPKSPYNGDNQKSIYAQYFRLSKDKVKRVHPRGIDQ